VTESSESILVKGNSTRWFTLRELSLTLLLVLVVALSSFKVLDDYAETDLDALFQRALVTFALARTLNGLISAVQGTEVALQPAGVGLTLTPGQILDPVNDLVERFSWIMLGATISLGVQNVLLDIGHWWGLRLILFVLSVTWLSFRLWRKKHSSANGSMPECVVLYALIAVLFVRFAVPLALIANETVYELFLESRYLNSATELEATGEELEIVSHQNDSQSENTNGVEDDEHASIFSRFFESARNTLDFEQQLQILQQKSASVIEHLIQLSVVFILQTGVLPLIFLWVLMNLFSQALRAARSAA
jgi:hypothetical protein